jgi:DNA-binding CsgD family transcriptional regulator
MRCQEVLSLVAEGLSDKQIAERLRIAERTVRAHIARSRDMVAAHNRSHLVAIAVHCNLLPDVSLCCPTGDLVLRQQRQRWHADSA